MEDNNNGYNNAKRQERTREKERNRKNFNKNLSFNKSKKLFDRVTCNKISTQKFCIEESSGAGMDNLPIPASKRTIVIHKGNQIFKRQILKASKISKTKKEPSNKDKLKKKSFEHLFHSFSQLALLSETNAIFGLETITAKIDTAPFPKKIALPAESTFMSPMSSQDITVDCNIHKFKRFKVNENSENISIDQKKIPFLIQNAEAIVQKQGLEIDTMPYHLATRKFESNSIFMSNSSKIAVTEFRKLGKEKHRNISVQNQTADSLLSNSSNNNLTIAEDIFNSSAEEDDVDKLMKEENRKYLAYSKSLAEGKIQIKSMEKIITQLTKEETKLEVKSKTNRIRSIAKTVANFSSANRLKSYFIFNNIIEKLKDVPMCTSETEALISTCSSPRTHLSEKDEYREKTNISKEFKNKINSSVYLDTNQLFSSNFAGFDQMVETHETLKKTNESYSSILPRFASTVVSAKRTLGKLEKKVDNRLSKWIERHHKKTETFNKNIFLYPES